jgi:hypothetical protein
LREGSIGLARAEDAAVEMVRVEEAPEPGITAAGENLHVAFAGKPLQLRLTEFENDPPTEEMARA